MSYTFNANGDTIVITAEDISKRRATSIFDIDDTISDLSTAMTIANEKVLWTNPETREGIWELVTTVPYTYEWIPCSNSLLVGGIITD